jgi:hypothetical protein
MSVFRGRFKKPRERVLESAVYRARDEYDCNRCWMPIFPHDEYIRTATLHEYYDAQNIWTSDVTVHREHLHCPD